MADEGSFRAQLEALATATLSDEIVSHAHLVNKGTAKSGTVKGHGKGQGKAQGRASPSTSTSTSTSTPSSTPVPTLSAAALLAILNNVSAPGGVCAWRSHITLVDAVRWSWALARLVSVCAQVDEALAMAYAASLAALLRASGAPAWSTLCSHSRTPYLPILIDATLRCLGHGALSDVPVLRLLGAQVLGAGVLARVLSALLPLCDARSVKEREVLRLALAALANALYKCSPVLSRDASLSHALSAAFALVHGVTFARVRALALLDVKWASVLAAALRAVQLFLSESRSLHLGRLPSLVSDVKKLLFYHHSDTEDTASDTVAAIGANVHEQLTASASASSDAEAAWKVRLHAQGLLKALAKVSKAELFAYWPQLLPTRALPASSTSAPPAKSLYALLLLDQHASVRSGAALLVAQLLEGAKAYLAHALAPVSSSSSGRSQVRAFTSLAQSQAQTLLDLHTYLGRALAEERDLGTRVHILRVRSLFTLCLSLQSLTPPFLKCVSALVAVTPYERLDPSLLRTLLALLASLVLQSLPPSASLELSAPESVVAAALSALGVLFSIATTRAVCEAELRSLVPKLLDELDLPSRPWLLRGELYAALAPLASTHLELFMEQWDRLVASLSSLALLQAQHPSLSLVSARVHSSSLLSSATSAVSGAGELRASCAKRVWLALLDGPLTLYCNDECNAVRASLASCLAALPSTLFSLLERPRRIACLTLLLALSAREEAPSVRSAACRALGHFVLFPPLRSDPLFVADAAIALTSALSDGALAVRLRACWALGNLCDALVAVREEHKEESEVDSVSRDELLLIVRASLAACDDHDRVRCNAVRALGNLTRFATPSFLAQEQSLLHEVVQALIANTASSISLAKSQRPRVIGVKVRWNAAYALGNLFRNRAIALHECTWTAPALAALGHLLAHADNFKVRINAASALSVPLQRRDYLGSAEFQALWRSLVAAVTRLREDFVRAEQSVTRAASLGTRALLEARRTLGYARTLRRATLQTLRHLLSLALPEDRALFGDSISEPMSHLVQDVLRDSPNDEDALRTLALLLRK